MLQPPPESAHETQEKGGGGQDSNTPRYYRTRIPHSYTRTTHGAFLTDPALAHTRRRAPADRLRTYPHVRFLSVCVLVPGPGDPPNPQIFRNPPPRKLRAWILFRTWARSPTLRTAGLRAHERTPPMNEHVGCLSFCANIPEVPEAWVEHIDTLA